MAGVGKTTVPEDPNKTTTGKVGCEMSICKAFLMDDPKEAYAHIRKNFETMTEYGDFAYGHALYTWDDGHRTLGRCRECGALIMIQRSEFHSFTDDDSYYADFFPIGSVREAEQLNRDYDGFAIERSFPRRYLMETDFRLSWSHSK